MNRRSSDKDSIKGGVILFAFGFSAVLILYMVAA